MKKWKCLVCGYIHTGEEPPDKCPVCGADKSKFILMESETPASTIDQNLNEDAQTHSDNHEPTSSIRINFLNKHPNITKTLTQYHAHPISVHIPNGVLPLSVFFAFFAVLFKSSSFATASSINMIFVLFSMPVVLLTGYIDWINRYKGNLTKIFKIKIGCGIVVTFLTFIIVIWRFFQPDILSKGFSSNILFILLHVFVLIPAIVAGFFGGKLVFKE